MRQYFQLLKSLSFVFIIIVIGQYVIVAQTVSGKWETSNDGRHSRRNLEDAEKTDEKIPAKNKFQLELIYQSAAPSGENRQSSSYALTELQGLTRQQIDANGDSKVDFRIVREAGTIECEGVFRNGKGSGSFRFTANPQFVAGMKARGFDFFKSTKNSGAGDPAARLLAATTINVTTALADDLKSANFINLDTEDLFKAAIFKIDSAFMREIKASGFPNIGMEELVKARIFKIDGAYLSGLKTAGMESENFENIVKMRIFKITPEFIGEIKREGFADLDIEDLVKLRIFNINGAFIRQAKAAGVPLRVESLVEKRIGVWNKKSNRASEF